MPGCVILTIYLIITQTIMDYKRKLIITGGAGFIGSHVVRLFVNKYPDYKIINLDKLTYAGNLANLKDIEDKPNYRFVKMDICDFEGVLKLMQEEQVDGIIHLAAESHVDRSIKDPFTFAQTNVMGTLSLLQAAKAYWMPMGWQMDAGMPVPPATRATLGTVRGGTASEASGGAERSEAVEEGAAAAATPPAPSAPAPRRRGGASAKLASLLDDTPAVVEVAEKAEAAPNRIPEDDEIIGRWPEFTAKFAAGRDRLERTLAAAHLSVTTAPDHKLLTFEVVNEAQKGWIMEKVLRDLENQYNAFLGTRSIRMAVGVIPMEDVGPKIYMPEEKAQDLMDKNPEVRNLVKDLALDTK